MVTRVFIGVDPHKLSATIEVLDDRETVLATGRFSTDKGGYAAMRKHVAAWPDRTWAVEGSNGAGRPLAQRLLADGELGVSSTRRGRRHGTSGGNTSTTRRRCPLFASREPRRSGHLAVALLLRLSSGDQVVLLRDRQALAQQRSRPIVGIVVQVTQHVQRDHLDVGPR